MTTHYSAPELSRLLDGVNSICERDGRRPELVVLNGRFSGGVPQNSRKTDQADKTEDEHEPTSR